MNNGRLKDLPNPLSTMPIERGRAMATLKQQPKTVHLLAGIFNSK
jgi:hypothetical protein